MTNEAPLGELTPPPEGATYLGSWNTLLPSSGVVEPSAYYLVESGKSETDLPDVVWRRTRNHWYGVCLASEWDAHRATLGDPLPENERTA